MNWTKRVEGSSLPLSLSLSSLDQNTAECIDVISQGVTREIKIYSIFSATRAIEEERSNRMERSIRGKIRVKRRLVLSFS